MKEHAVAMPALTSDVVRCAGCERAWPIEAWRELPTMATLTDAEIRGHVSSWPVGAVVEVRACGGCGRAIARRRRAAA
jgi:hypothetical protein